MKFTLIAFFRGLMALCLALGTLHYGLLALLAFGAPLILLSDRAVLFACAHRDPDRPAVLRRSGYWIAAVFTAMFLEIAAIFGQGALDDDQSWFLIFGMILWIVWAGVIQGHITDFDQ